MNNKPHITILAPYKIFPSITGGQKCISLLYSYLQHYLPLSILGTNNNEDGGTLESSLQRVMNHSKLRYLNPFLLKKIKTALKQHQSELLILEHPYMGWLGVMAAKLYGCKLVIHSHNIESTRFKSTGKWWWGILWNYERWVHRHAAVNFFITEEDRQFAIKHFALMPSRCHIVTYGIEWQKPPSETDRNQARQYLQSTHNIAPNEKIILFNGTLDYLPNLEAVNIILNEINPRLQQLSNFKYRILICGKNLPDTYLKNGHQLAPAVEYTGFVKDIGLYFKGADIFINPVTEGGGIKTKLVEALGHNLSSVSTSNGAFGISTSVTGNKLIIAGDKDWDSFCKAIMSCSTSENIPDAFFKEFYWGNIAGKAAEILSEEVKKQK